MKEEKSLSVMDRMAGTFRGDDRELVDEMYREVRAGIMSKRDESWVINKAYNLAYGEEE